MRISTLFGRTLRDLPADLSYPALRLGLRAGLLRLCGAGRRGELALLPLGLRALRRIERALRAELEALEAQELRLPLLQQAGPWQEQGASARYGALLLRCQPDGESELALAADYELAWAELAGRELSSYRQLPLIAYQIAPLLRDEARPRLGPLRLREFSVLDVASFQLDQGTLETTGAQVRAAFERALARCSIAAIPAESAGGSRVWLARSDYGEAQLARCGGCGYAATEEVARRAEQPPAPRPAEPLELVATPDCPTIAALASLLDIPETATAKAVFLWGAGRGLIFAVIRGDLDVSLAKLALAAGLGPQGAAALRPATAEEIVAAGAVPGYASPVGLRDLLVIADHSVVSDGAGGPPALVAGANRPGYHLRGVTYGRDWQASLVADVAQVCAGDPCPVCGAALTFERGYLLGRASQTGAELTSQLGASALDPQGRPTPLLMGHYRLGLERLLSAVIEQHHDEAGIVWPSAVAPLPLHLVALGKGAEARQSAESLYATLQQAGLPTLYDDRDESPGVKFADADLIGLPLRVVISERLLRADQLEIKRRRDGAISLVSRSEAAGAITALLDEA